MTNAKLKPGWKTWRFDQIAINVNDRIDDPSKSGADYYVGLEHLDPESLKIRRWGSPTDVEATKLIFKKGDIILGRRRVYQRKLAVAEFDGICSAHAMVLRPREDVVAKEFLPFFMQSDLFMERALAISVGSLSPTINWKTLAKQEFALPPLDEQRRIAEVLWAIFSMLEETKKLDLAADRWRRALLVDVFRPLRGNRDVFPLHWSEATAEELGEVQLGQQRHPKFKTGNNIRPYLRVANVMDGWLDLSDLLYMHFPTNELNKFELKPGDILLNEGQSYDLVGRSAIYRGEIEGCCLQKTLLRFRCGPRLLPEFTHLYFQHMLYTGQFSRLCVQTTSMAHLTAVRFRKLNIPVPDLHEQREIVEHVLIAQTGISATRAQLKSTRILGKAISKMVLI